MIDKSKIKNYIVIAISIILIIIAISLVTSSKFKYVLENIDYYTEQYEEYKSKSSGSLGGAYALFVSHWKDLRDDAIRYVTLHSIGAIALSGIGVVGLCFGLKKLKSTRNEEDDLTI